MSQSLARQPSTIAKTSSSLPMSWKCGGSGLVRAPGICCSWSKGALVFSSPPIGRPPCSNEKMVEANVRLLGKGSFQLCIYLLLCLLYMHSSTFSATLRQRVLWQQQLVHDSYLAGLQPSPRPASLCRSGAFSRNLHSAQVRAVRLGMHPSREILLSPTWPTRTQMKIQSCGFPPAARALRRWGLSCMIMCRDLCVYVGESARL